MTQPPSCLSEVGFSSLLQYSPHGRGPVASASRRAVLWIKRGEPGHIERLAERAAESNAAGSLGTIFGEDVVLVPVPRSQPQRPGSLWPALRIAEELHRCGLAGSVEPTLIRREALVKSALLRLGSMRPGPTEHMRTIAVLPRLVGGARRVTLIDDVVTRGATLLGTASLLVHSLPCALVGCFAAIRAMGATEIDSMLSPVQGRISFHEGRLHREP